MRSMKCKTVSTVFAFNLSILKVFCLYFSDSQSPTAHESHWAHVRSIVLQYHCSVHYGYPATQDNANTAS